MELYLNYAWLSVAVASVCLWLRFGRCKLANKHLALIGLFLFIVVLLPAISVSDDLSSIQSPAEVKSLEHRNQCTICQHFGLKSIASLHDAIRLQLDCCSQFLSLQPRVQLIAADNPAIHPIQNRPPPAA